MKKIRIHKDITIRWDVTTNGKVVSLEGRDLTLLLTDASGRMIILPYSITNTNRLTATFYGKDQSKLGAYIISLAENLGKECETIVDSKDAFILVARSWQEGIFGRNDISTSTIELSGDIVVGGRGMSAYEHWLSLGNTGTVEDFMLALKGPKGDTGEKGDTGGQGPKGDTGSQGVGIEDVRQVSFSSESLGENVIRVRLTNGKSYDITVKNGAQGETGKTGATGPQGPQGTDGKTGPVGPQGPKGDSIIVEDTLESGSTENALSASRGRELNYMKLGFRNPDGETAPAGDFPFISFLEQNLTDAEKAQARANIGVSASVDVVDSLDSTSAQKALSANQGRILNSKIVVKATIDELIGVEKQRAELKEQELEAKITTKQDVITDLATIRSNAALVSGKQDTISDLANIRAGIAVIPSLQKKITKSSILPAGGMLPGVYYDLGQITEATVFDVYGENADELEEYMIQFTIGGSVPTLSWLCVDAWEGGSEPAWEADKTYVVAITNRLAVCGKF